MTAPFVTIRTFAEIPAAISRMQIAGAGHRVPLMQALYRGRIAHLEIQRNTSARTFKQWAGMARLPALALVGDDDYADPCGPDTWHLAERALRWARAVIIHGGRGEVAHYDMAVTFAESIGRVLMVECASATVEGWRCAVDRWGQVPCLILAPETGNVHPCDSREAMQ